MAKRREEVHKCVVAMLSNSNILPLIGITKPYPYGPPPPPPPYGPPPTPYPADVPERIVAFATKCVEALPEK